MRSAGCGAWSANLSRAWCACSGGATRWTRSRRTSRRPAVVAAVHARWDRFAPLRPRLETAIHGREQELSSGSPADLAALERLAASSGSPCRHGSARRRRGTGAQRAARHVGLALGLVRLLQGVPGDLLESPLPRTLLARHQLDPERVDPRAAEALRPAVAEAHEASARASA